jgi:hypothetical protein
MKRNLMRAVNANLRKFIRASTVVVILTSATSLSAQVTPVSAGMTDAPGKANVTYVATSNQSLFFDVKVENVEGEKFVIIVKDDNGTTLYRGSSSEKDFKKRFILPKSDSGKLTFNIKSESGVKSETFEINTNTRVVEEVTVKKVI